MSPKKHPCYNKSSATKKAATQRNAERDSRKKLFNRHRLIHFKKKFRNNQKYLF